MWSLSVCFHLYHLPCWFQFSCISALAECPLGFDLQTSWSKEELVWNGRTVVCVFVPGSAKTPYWLDVSYSMETDLSWHDCMVSAFQTPLHNMTRFGRFVRPIAHTVMAVWSIKAVNTNPKTILGVKIIFLVCKDHGENNNTAVIWLAY